MPCWFQPNCGSNIDMSVICLASCGYCCALPTFSAAPAFATAMETPRMALAPRLPLFFDPSVLRRSSSTAFWSVTLIPESIRAGPRVLMTFSTAFETPLPRYLDLSPSLSSTASWTPVDAPDGTAALNRPVWYKR